MGTRLRRGEPCFANATERFKELAGDTVRVGRGPRADDNYGRILFHVYTNDGECIDEILVREGLAKAWTRDGQHRDVLVAAKESARRDKRGFLSKPTLVTPPLGSSSKP